MAEKQSGAFENVADLIEEHPGGLDDILNRAKTDPNVVEFFDQFFGEALPGLSDDKKREHIVTLLSAYREAQDRVGAENVDQEVMAQVFRDQSLRTFIEHFHDNAKITNFTVENGRGDGNDRFVWGSKFLERSKKGARSSSYGFGFVLGARLDCRSRRGNEDQARRLAA